MNLLFIGDIFASPGRRIVADHLNELIETEKLDLIVANAENSAGGFGVTPGVAEELLGLGIDVLTTGNHVWDKREVYDYLPRQPRLLRPGNYPDTLPGTGLYEGTARNGVKFAVMNLQGRVHMPATDCPFRKADSMLAALSPETKVIFLDFHAEVTSEKAAMGWYLDGRASAVIGTHTHIPTADGRLLRQGTAFQTDAGMTGPYESIIGVEKDAVLHRFQTSLPVRFEAARGWVELRGAIVDIDETTGRARAIRPVCIKA
jgi:2',3'-cyclic-nucleotide 2'-phosphodiesterase